MLASDTANPDFEGPKDPDATLFVRFYWHEPIDKWESEKLQKEVKGPRQVFIHIQKPGDELTIIQVPATDYHKVRFAKQWMAWQVQEGLLDGQYEVPGWKLDEWNELNQEQVHELKYLRFSTVEQIAGASDAQVQRLGMGGMALREKAKTALRNKMGAETKDALEAKEKEIAEMKERMARLEAALLNAAPQAAPSAGSHSGEDLPPAEAAPKKRGRPKKEQAVIG